MAIALDASASGINSAGGVPPTAVTVAHTIGSGSNRAVIVCATGRNNNVTTGPSFTATYNGTSMTAATSLATDGNRCASQIFYLLDASLPAAGTYNVVVTASNTSSTAYNDVGCSVYSLTGAKQSAQPDATNTYGDAVGGSSISKNITTVADNSWIVDCLLASTAAATGATAAGSQANAIVLKGTNELHCSSTLGPVTPAAATATGWGTFVTANPLRFAYAQVSVSPATTATVTGTLAVTEANDTLAAAGAVGATGTLAVTDDADTLVASGTYGTVATTTTTTVGSGPKDDVHPETRRYWETERQRLRILRDDDEILLLI